MRLRLRQFEFRAVTSNGDYGVTIPFSTGLVVLRGDNSSGKSTCLQGVIYALGMEGMLSSSQSIPLPHVATAFLTDDDHNTTHAVLESSVTLEFENERGQVATVRRYAKHDTFDTRLIRMWEGPLLTGGGAIPEKSFFVRRPGSAQREAGFYHWLAEFIGWELPEVPRYDGTQSLLYLETIFPLFFVEQKRGWAGIQAQTPTYFRIRDVGRRNVGFVLKLSGSDIAEKRQALKERMAQWRNRWEEALSAFKEGASNSGVIAQGMPETPQVDWPSDIAPTLWIVGKDELIPIDLELSQLRTDIEALNGRLIPSAGAKADAVSESLRRNLDELHEISNLINGLYREVVMEEDQIRSLASRSHSLRHDVQRSQDIETLRTMGAPADALLQVDCPTCHQELPSTLLDPSSAIVAMPIERNIKLLKEQIELFVAMEEDLNSAVLGKKQRLVILEERQRELQQNIRAERETLVSPQNAPSIEDIEARVRMRSRVEALELLQTRLGQLIESLEPISLGWMECVEEQNRLREYGTSADDLRRLSALQISLIDQLREYGFSSVPSEQLSISEDTYLPEHEGFDLAFDLSASDMVRTIWAHRIGLLEVARNFESNHSQLLVFDEPRQQSADPVSFSALLRRASKCAEFGQQVIFATSEPAEVVQEMLSGVPHSYIEFQGKLIKKI